jgi:hypothetical protein
MLVLLALVKGRLVASKQDRGALLYKFKSQEAQLFLEV